MSLTKNNKHHYFVLWKKNGIKFYYDQPVLSFTFLKQDYDYILCLKFDSPDDNIMPDVNELTNSLEAVFNDAQHTFVVLTLRKQAPLYQVSNDEYIYSFSCNFNDFKKLIHMQHQRDILTVNLLFELLDCIGNGDTCIENVIVRQIPFTIEEVSDNQNCDVIIPHRGRISYLRHLMQFLNPIKGINVFSGIDQPAGEQIMKFKDNYPNFSFYSFKPNPVGPYYIRNWLIDQGKSDFIAFQDSDDIPCADRFQRLTQHMTKNKTPLCGSHEIKMDYFIRSAQAVRYPIIVNNALERSPAHALLHPSSAILREAFYFCNRLSDNVIMASDSKFLYYSYFKIGNIENVDEFLYIRRSRPGSLTTSPKTGIGSPARTYLRNRWVIDFTLVKLNLLSLEDSCLTYDGTKRKIEVKKL